MADFLLELRCEEIPARMQPKAKEDLARLFADALAKAGLAVGLIETFATPRRLALIAKDLPLTTTAVAEETKGPKVGAPPQALEGFLRKVGLTAEQLIERDGVHFAVVEKPGRETAQVLAETIPAIIRAFPWPKSMRWGAGSITTESLRWVRPLSGIIALLDGAVVPCEIDGIASGRTTMGHRFHHSGPVDIADVGAYIETLRAAHVVVHFSERCKLIREGAAKVAAEAGLTLVADEGLVIENAGLTEWPVPLLGRFDETFLDVPPEVIQLTARVNQKYFVCENADGKLANAFVCTANIDAIDPAVVVDGNRKVLAARLSDARFFWEQDQKKTLAEHAKGLSRITYHETLGTVADKVERVAKLAETLVTKGFVQNCDPTLARQAAEMCKADLVTEMVGEFPELQGIMGAYYAAVEGFGPEIIVGIRYHYKPAGPNDETPTEPVAVAISLADKLDTLSAFFSIGETPTGSKDPYALRRATLGALRIVIANDLPISLRDLVAVHIDICEQMAFDRYVASRPDVRDFHLKLTSGSARRLDIISEIDNLEDIVSREKKKMAFFDYDREPSRLRGIWNDVENKLYYFFEARLEQMLLDQGLRQDLVSMVMSSSKPIPKAIELASALAKLIATEDGRNLLAGYNRAANILKKEGYSVTPAEAGASGGSAQTPEVPAFAGMTDDLSYTPESAEAALIDALAVAAPRAAEAVEAERFADAMAALATLRAPIDRFFEEVIVNDADANKRAARLALLARFRDAVHRVADFSRIEG